MSAESWKAKEWGPQAPAPYPCVVVLRLMLFILEVARGGCSLCGQAVWDEVMVAQ